MNDAMDAAVLVKGWKKGANWSFPRGKINWAEDDLTCAAREVYEETGYDVEAAGLIPEDRQVKHIEISMHDQQMRLYVFRNVPMDTHFEPRTRKEISKIQWWRLSDLPAYRKKGQQQQNGPATSPNKFYMVAPFLPHLRKWIIEQKKQDARRSMSNQYLSAGMSHDEFLTEEDQGAESNTQGPSYPTPARQHIDTLEGTNEALRALLKIQPPAQGLQSSAGVAIQSPVAENKGNALLALLQGKPAISSQQPPPTDAFPHTPLEHTLSQAPQPITPHHQQPQPPHFSTLPPPPTFPIQPSNSFSYQDPAQQSYHQSNSIPGFPQNQIRIPNHAPRLHETLHSYQSPHLVHPQPLPPHVQRAVFTGGPVHSPMVPQPVQQPYQRQLHPAASSGPINPQFPGLHAPMVPLVQEQPPAKLTSHHLALLNAFKHQDHANGATEDKDLPLRRFTEAPAQPQPPRPQELPAEVARPVALDPPSQASLKQPVAPTQNPSLLAPKPISEEQRSALLGLFKSPIAQAAVPSANTAKAFPSTTPSAVELSAVDTLASSAARASPAVGHKKATKEAAKNVSVPEMNPETNLPYRAMKILARPTQAQASDSESPRGNTSVPKAHQNGKRPISRNKSKQPSSPGKSFQPQILKRPQPGTQKTTEPSGIANPSTLPTLPILPTHNQQQVRLTSDPKQTLQPLPGKAPSSADSLPQLDRRTAQPIDQKQKLLSLFGASPAIPPVGETSAHDILAPLFSIDPTMNTSARSRMGSLGSGEASRRSSQTPMSPADKGFLLSYLDSVAKGVQR